MKEKILIIKSKNLSSFENEYVEKVILNKINHVSYKYLEDLKKEDFLIINKEFHVIFQVSDVIRNSETFKNIDECSKNLDEFSLIHLGDETLSQSYEFYKNCKVVLRAYFNPNIEYKNYTIPVGFQSGFKNEQRTKDEKFYKWVFFGQLHNDRYRIINYLKTLIPNLYQKSEYFMDKNSISVERQKEIYEKSMFVVCPFGVINPDTFRIMETLEGGSIPIIKRFYFTDYFKFIYGDHPFPTVVSWRNASKLITYYSDNKNKYDELHNAIEEWYINYLNNLSEDIKNLIYGNENVQSKQFYYQKNHGRKLSVVFSFWFEFKFKRMKYIYRINKIILRIYYKIISLIE
tara:strand:- start:2413 stop:3450 length:1038 start_codon:yes stop_codon:yes gene_type:complete